MCFFGGIAEIVEIYRYFPILTIASHQVPMPKSMHIPHVHRHQLNDGQNIASLYR